MSINHLCQPGSIKLNWLQGTGSFGENSVLRIRPASTLSGHPIFQPMAKPTLTTTTAFCPTSTL